MRRADSRRHGGACSCVQRATRARPPERRLTRLPWARVVQTTGPREYDRTRCAVVFLNGEVVGDELSTAQLLDDPLVTHLEAVEYCRYWFEAPMDCRQTPPYLMNANMSNCSVIALWQRRTPVPRYLGAAQPFRGRLATGPAWQQFGGRHAPAAAALRAELLWYARPNLAVGLHGRSTAAPVNAADLTELTSGAEGLGQRDYTVQLYGVEGRVDLREVLALTPFVTDASSSAARSTRTAGATATSPCPTARAPGSASASSTA
jgi:hypothetical protein